MIRKIRFIWVLCSAEAQISGFQNDYFPIFFEVSRKTLDVMGQNMTANKMAQSRGNLSDWLDTLTP